jgi:hypothetical protein
LDHVPTSQEEQFMKWKLICMASLHMIFVGSGLIFAITEKNLHQSPEGGH